ncbi:prostaglandin reductase 3, partial [Trichonephila clavipes]
MAPWPRAPVIPQLVDRKTFRDNRWLIYHYFKSLNRKLIKMSSIPKTYKRLMVQKLTTNFRDAVTIETTEMCNPENGEVCIKNKYVGINTTDINMTKGASFVSHKVPFGVGSEGIGKIVKVGRGARNLKVGQSVTFLNPRCDTYAEYVCIPALHCFPVPESDPRYLSLLVNGLAATKGLFKVAHIRSGESVLITTAAGGVGHIAVQVAKAAGCHVIGTCSSEEKEKVLKDLRCDRIVNYNKEDLGQVLENEYPNGVNVIWETIGGKVFDDCLKNISVKGRLLIVGNISGNNTENKEALIKRDLSSLQEQNIRKSEVRKLIERSNLFGELDDYEFQRRFRLTKQSVAELTLLIEEKLESKTPCNNALNPVEQVLIALRFYAVACMQLAIADLFDVSQPTVCRVVHRVSEAIASLLPDFIHPPVNREECKT